MSQQHERYITAREVAERVGLTPGTIVRYFNEGLIPGRQLPGKMRPVRFLWSEVEASWSGLAEQAADQARQSWNDRLGGRAA
jgi:predicted DNA-binding transcriptional regulator AlpA